MGPSTYVPLTRRFTNERARELRETRELYLRVKARQDAFTETKETIGADVYGLFRQFSGEVRERIAFALYDFLEAESCLSDVPPPNFDRMDLKEFVEYRNLLNLKEYFFANEDRLLELLREGLSATLLAVTRDLPEMEEPAPFTIPLVYALPDPREAMDLVIGALCKDEFINAGLFREVSNKVIRNAFAASGRDPETDKSSKPLKLPSQADLPLDRLVEVYFAGTPLHQILTVPIPLRLTHEDRFNHMHVVGGTGAGKTTLIENLILHDLRSDDPPSLVVIDPHGDLIRRLTRYDLGRDPIIIDPRDTRHPVALNPLAVNHERLGTYDEATREQVTAGVIQTFGYLWNGLTNLTLTGKQEVFFRYVTRLLLSFPESMGRNATILDMLDIMKPRKKEEAHPFAPAMAALQPIAREFFEHDFNEKTFDGTREQIRYRIQAIIENPTMARLFTATETKVDFFTELNRGSIILVDTAKDFLKEGSAVLGKLMISLILQAVLERAALPEGSRKPTFLLVDEAGSFFSQNIDDLLTEARKYRCGLVLAHQYLDQATGSLRASLAANTGIKFASGLSASDARAMAPEMRTSADFILDQPKLQFAAHIRHVTPQAVSIPIRIIKDIPRLSPEAHAELVERNRRRVTIPLLAVSTARSTTTPPADPSEPDEDISREW